MVMEKACINGIVKSKAGRLVLENILRSDGLRPRDIRSVDPSLWLMNSMPALLVVEAALISRIQGLEQRLMDIEPKIKEVAGLLEVLPMRLTADVLEQLRLSKQNLVELGSRAGALKQMLLDLLEDPNEIRRICIMGRNCTIHKGNNELECSVPIEKQIAEESSCKFPSSLGHREYQFGETLKRTIGHETSKRSDEEKKNKRMKRDEDTFKDLKGTPKNDKKDDKAERLLDSAREMEDSIAVNLSSRRLEVSRVELLLQVGTFCVAVGALVAGIFGMNLKSYLEQHVVQAEPFCFSFLHSSPLPSIYAGSLFTNSFSLLHAVGFLVNDSGDNRWRSSSILYYV
ncbi:hypothetical protein ACLOJK_020910 [Asimina triloba]